MIISRAVNELWHVAWGWHVTWSAEAFHLIPER